MLFQHSAKKEKYYLLQLQLLVAGIINLFINVELDLPKMLVPATSIVL